MSRLMFPGKDLATLMAVGGEGGHHTDGTPSQWPGGTTRRTAPPPSGRGAPHEGRHPSQWPGGTTPKTAPPPSGQGAPHEGRHPLPVAGGHHTKDGTPSQWPGGTTQRTAPPPSGRGGAVLSVPFFSLLDSILHKSCIGVVMVTIASTLTYKCRLMNCHLLKSTIR